MRSCDVQWCRAVVVMRVGITACRDQLTDHFEPGFSFNLSGIVQRGASTRIRASRVSSSIRSPFRRQVGFSAGFSGFPSVASPRNTSIRRRSRKPAATCNGVVPLSSRTNALAPESSKARIATSLPLLAAKSIGVSPESLCASTSAPTAMRALITRTSPSLAGGNNDVDPSGSRAFASLPSPSSLRMPSAPSECQEPHQLVPTRHQSVAASGATLPQDRPVAGTQERHPWGRIGRSNGSPFRGRIVPT